MEVNDHLLFCSAAFAIEAHLACPIGDDEEHGSDHRQIGRELHDLLMAGLGINYCPEVETVEVESGQQKKCEQKRSTEPGFVSHDNRKAAEYEDQYATDESPSWLDGTFRL